MGPDPPEGLGMACSACYYLVISSTHMSNGHFRRVKGVFRGPLCATSTNDSPECAERALGCSAEDLKALFYCELCHKQYLRHQEFDNHINSYDHAHKQRLKELKHREFSRNVASKSWKDQRKQEKALRRLHKLAQLQQDSQRVPGRSPAMAVSQQRDRDMDQGDHRPLNHTQRPTPMQPMTVRLSQPPKDPYRSLSQTPLTTALEEPPLITLQASSAGPPAANAQPRLYLQVPLPGQERTGGRLGVSFCFSRRGPKLVPSASVFSDLEEEDREKREQMKERIRGIREDMDKEIGDVKERRPNKNKKVIPDNVAQSDLVPIPSEAARREEDTEKRDLVKEHSLSTLASGNHSSDQVFSPSKTHMTIWGSEIAQIDTEYKNGEPMRNQESEEAKVESQYMCVLSKDDSTCLKWPVSLLKFTKSQPHICYSCKPLCLISHQTKVVTEDVQGSQPNQICALSGESNPQVPPTLVSDAHTCLQRQTKQERGAHRPEKAAEDFKAEQYINVQTEEHLSLKNKNLSSSETRPERGGCTLNMENCVKTASHSFDPAHSNSSDPISQNPMGGRLRGARGIRERAIIALSCKSESVITSGTQGMCIRPSRCECGGETICEGASTPKTFVGASEVSCKKRKVSKKKPRLGKSNRGERKKASKKRQSARRKVRSVVSTVSTVRERNREAGGGWSGKKRHGEMRRRVQRTGSSCLLGRCKAEPVSVFVRKRKSHRSYSTESQSPTDRKQTQHCNGFSQLHRYSADRDTKVERGPDGDAVSSPWHSHFTLHSFSPGCNSKLFWGRGHHSNPRSFFNCCYPDKSCGSNLAKKRKLHGDKKLIYHKRNHLRHRDVWEGTEADRNTGGSAGYRDRGLISEKERPEWMRESCPRGWRSRSKAVEWSRLERLSPSPRRWGMRHRHLSTEDVDWDRCSMDRWTWGSSDSGDDRDTHRSRAGPRPVADIRGSPGFVLKCTKETKHPSLKHSSSPEWWPSRQAYSPYISMRASGSQSPRPCSPCSTSISELSWEWSRSSTCSGVTVDGLTVSSCRTSSVDPGPSTEVLQGTKKLSPTMSTLSDLNSCQLSQSLPHRPSFAPNATCINTYQCDTSPTQQKQTHSQPDLGQGSSVDVTGNRSGTTAGPSPTKSVLQKSARMLLLPLIGKLPAIQRKARRDKWILGKLQEKRGEDEEGAKCSGQYSDIVTKCPLDIAESTSNSIPNLSPSQYTTDKRKTAVDAASPISFTAEEMDKYSRLQEKAREHMQKVLKNRQESADIDMETNYTHSAQANNCGTLEEHYTPGSLHNLSQPQTQSFHAETMQAQAQHTLQVNVPLRRVAQQELFTQRMLGVTDLPPLPPSPPLSSLCHIILQQTSLPLPPVSSSLSASSPSAAIHPQPAQLPHTLAPFQTSLPHHLHLSTYSITSLFPSILLSPHPISLLHQSPTFHATPIPRLSPVALQPLHPQPFMDRAWSVRFQQKAL